MNCIEFGSLISYQSAVPSPAKLERFDWLQLQLTTQGVPSRIGDTNYTFNLKICLLYSRFWIFTIFQDFYDFFRFDSFTEEEEDRFRVRELGLRVPQHGLAFRFSCAEFN